MNDDGVPSGWAGRIKDLERRIRTLETAQRIRSSGIQGGKLEVNDDDGSRIVSFGEYNPNLYGIRANAVGDETINLFEVNQHGVVLPFIPHPWRPSSLTPVSITSGTFVDCWRWKPHLLAGPNLEFTVLITQDAGTECEIQLKNVSSGILIGSPFAITATSKTCIFKGPHNIPVRLVSGRNVSLECRRTVGAGTVLVHWPSEAAVGGLLPGGTIGWS